MLSTAEFIASVPPPSDEVIARLRELLGLARGLPVDTLVLAEVATPATVGGEAA